MKYLIKLSKIALICVIVLNPAVFAQPIHESEMFNSQVSLQGASRSGNINIKAEVLTPESAKYEINEDTPINETLPVLSEMLNRDVEAKAGTSFESIRRNSIFSVETTLVSRFLGIIASKQSA